MILPTGLFLVALWVLLAWFYREYRIDAYRQRLFALRDELWDYAAAGRVSFDHPAYRLVRDRINGLIRFAHLLGPAWLLIGIVVNAIRPTPAVMREFARELSEAMKGAPKEVAAELTNYHQRALMLAVEHIVLVSPLFWVLVAPIVLIGIVRLAWIKAADVLRRLPGMDLLDTEAARLGAVG